MAPQCFASDVIVWDERSLVSTHRWLWPGRVSACPCVVWPFVGPGLHLVASRKVRGTSVGLVPGCPESCPQEAARPSWAGGPCCGWAEGPAWGLPVSRLCRCVPGAEGDLACGGCPQPAALPALPLTRCPRPHSHPPVFLPVGFVVGSWVDPAGTAGRQQSPDLREAARPCWELSSHEAEVHARGASLAGSPSEHQGQVGNCLLPGMPRCS